MSFVLHNWNWIIRQVRVADIGMLTPTHGSLSTRWCRFRIYIFIPTQPRAIQDSVEQST